jgi:hypothetical protein
VAGFIGIHGNVIRDALSAVRHGQKCPWLRIPERACQFAATKSAVLRRQYLRIVRCTSSLDGEGASPNPHIPIFYIFLCYRYPIINAHVVSFFASHTYVILYAVSSSLYDLQRMLFICERELLWLDNCGH